MIMVSNLRVNKNGAVSAFSHHLENPYFLVYDEIIVFHYKIKEKGFIQWVPMIAESENMRKDENGYF